MAELAFDNTASNDAQTFDVVIVTKAVGDHLRANILKAMAADSFAVLELCDIFDMAQPAMSHHLKKLSEAGLVNKRREGTNVFYQRTPAHHAPLLSAIYTALDAETLADVYQSGIDDVHKARLAHSKNFFTHQADALAKQTALICAPEVYVQAVVNEAISNPDLTRNNALEIGPGDGMLMQALAPHFERVDGIDNSAEMLARTQDAVTNLNNAKLVEQDFGTLADTTKYDLVVAAMVVHHMPSPLAFFQQAARVLRNNGLLVIAELCDHDQEWVKELCGDIWLGFNPEELVRWSTQVGLQQIQQQFLAQRNGFRVQVSAFALATSPSNTSLGNSV